MLTCEMFLVSFFVIAKIFGNPHPKATQPLSVEWEDAGMDRLHGAKEAFEYIKKTDFKTSEITLDAAFQDK